MRKRIKSEVEYAQEAYELFKWLVKNTNKRRTEYPGYRTLEEYPSDCPACAYTIATMTRVGCPDRCPIRTACRTFCSGLVMMDGDIETRRIVRDSCKKWLYRAKKRAEKK